MLKITIRKQRCSYVYERAGQEKLKPSKMKRLIYVVSKPLELSDLTNFIVYTSFDD